MDSNYEVVKEIGSRIKEFTKRSIPAVIGECCYAPTYGRTKKGFDYKLGLENHHFGHMESGHAIYHVTCVGIIAGFIAGVSSMFFLELTGISPLVDESGNINYIPVIPLVAPLVTNTASGIYEYARHIKQELSLDNSELEERLK